MTGVSSNSQLMIMIIVIVICRNYIVNSYLKLLISSAMSDQSVCFLAFVTVAERRKLTNKVITLIQYDQEECHIASTFGMKAKTICSTYCTTIESDFIDILLTTSVILFIAEFFCSASQASPSFSSSFCCSIPVPLHYNMLPA